MVKGNDIGPPSAIGDRRPDPPLEGGNSGSNDWGEYGLLAGLERLVGNDYAGNPTIRKFPTVPMTAPGNSGFLHSTRTSR